MAATQLRVTFARFLSNQGLASPGISSTTGNKFVTLLMSTTEPSSVTYAQSFQSMRAVRVSATLKCL